MLVMMTEATLSPYFTDGPIYPPQGFEVDYCEKSWWKNLLYINNLFDPAEMVTKQCVLSFNIYLVFNVEDWRTNSQFYTVYVHFSCLSLSRLTSEIVGVFKQSLAPSFHPSVGHSVETKMHQIPLPNLNA